jgi:erythromycin esterase
MDSQHTSALAAKQLMPHLKSSLMELGRWAPFEGFWPEFERLALQLVAMERRPPEAALQARFFEFVRTLQVAFSGPEQFFSQRLVASLNDQARRYWGLDAEQRSAAMAENLLALIKHRHANRKVIVWGHFVHMNRTGLPQGGNVGSALATRFKERVYVAHFTGNKGNYYNFFNDQNTPVVPLPINTIESRLSKQQGAINFTDWRALPLRLKQDPLMQASLNYYLPDGLFDAPGPAARWQQRVDGTFFLDRITSPRP